MFRSVIRALVFLDDLAELVLVGLGRRIRARWRALVAVALVGAGAVAFQPRPAPPAVAPELEVFEIREMAKDRHAARVVYGSAASVVVEVGDVLPDREHPQLVIASIDCLGVNAVRIGEASVLRRLARTPHAPVAMRVLAIAGDDPNYVAVVEVGDENHIVQPGSKIPDQAHPRLTITAVTSTRVDYIDHVMDRRSTVRLITDESSDLELDLEGI